MTAFSGNLSVHRHSGIVNDLFSGLDSLPSLPARSALWPSGPVEAERTVRPHDAVDSPGLGTTDGGECTCTGEREH